MGYGEASVLPRRRLFVIVPFAARRQRATIVYQLIAFVLSALKRLGDVSKRDHDQADNP